jgi:hypothetical protein
MTRPKLAKTIAREMAKTHPVNTDKMTGICAICHVMVHPGDWVTYYPRESKMECFKCLCEDSARP